MMKNCSLGLPDEEFIRGKVPMTKREIRILTIVNANIHDGDMVLDVGAGTGSLSCEAALQTPHGTVFALERNPEGIALIEQNARHFLLNNIQPIKAEAPAGMDDLPTLDAALIGGSGHNLAEILDRLDQLLKIGGTIVINSVTLQTLQQAVTYMKNKDNFAYDLVQVQINRWEKVGTYDMSKAINPVFIMSCRKLS